VYVGFSGLYAIENFDVDEEYPGIRTNLNPTNSWGVAGRLGYRFHPNFAAEIGVDWYENFEFEGIEDSDPIRAEDGWSVWTNGKLYPLPYRIQPYLLGGAGLLHMDRQVNLGFLPPQEEVGLSDEEDLSFAGRFGLGLDFYVLPEIVLNLEASYVLPVGDLNELQFIPLTFGVQYRFGTRPEIPKPPPSPFAEPGAPAGEQPPPKPPLKRRIVLRGVNFDFDKAEIRPDAQPVLDEAIRILKRAKTVRVIAEGHTDSVGSDQYNEKLSLRRAEAVRDYLVAGGIDPARVEVKGFGESQPVASNETDDGRAQNRRVELRVTGRQ
jgi:outer membrane protein OmpA-like peptidoglycan-associated protein